MIPKKGESLLEAYEIWRTWADEKGIVDNNTCNTCNSVSVVASLLHPEPGDLKIGNQNFNTGCCRLTSMQANRPVPTIIIVSCIALYSVFSNPRSETFAGLYMYNVGAHHSTLQL